MSCWWQSIWQPLAHSAHGPSMGMSSCPPDYRNIDKLLFSLSFYSFTNICHTILLLFVKFTASAGSSCTESLPDHCDLKNLLAQLSSMFSCCVLGGMVNSASSPASFSCSEEKICQIPVHMVWLRNFAILNQSKSILFELRHKVLELGIKGNCFWSLRTNQKILQLCKPYHEL